jgi:hypothetical protein
MWMRISGACSTLPKLPPYRINSRGHLQEWIEDWVGGTEGHNTSPNFPLFPGSTILCVARRSWLVQSKWMGLARVTAAG